MRLAKIKIVPDLVRPGFHQVFIDGRDVSAVLSDYSVSVKANQAYARVTVTYLADLEIEPIEFMAILDETS